MREKKSVRNKNQKAEFMFISTFASHCLISASVILLSWLVCEQEGSHTSPSSLFTLRYHLPLSENEINEILNTENHTINEFLEFLCLQ